MIFVKIFNLIIITLIQRLTIDNLFVLKTIVNFI